VKYLKKLKNTGKIRVQICISTGLLVGLEKGFLKMFIHLCMRNVALKANDVFHCLIKNKILNSSTQFMKNISKKDGKDVLKADPEEIQKMRIFLRKKQMENKVLKKLTDSLTKEKPTESKTKKTK